MAKRRNIKERDRKQAGSEDQSQSIHKNRFNRSPLPSRSSIPSSKFELVETDAGLPLNLAEQRMLTDNLQRLATEEVKPSLFGTQSDLMLFASLGHRKGFLAALNSQPNPQFVKISTDLSLNGLCELLRLAKRGVFNPQASWFVFEAFEHTPIPFSRISAVLERLAGRAASSIIGRPEAEIHDPTMVEQDNKVLVQDGVRYRPLSLAAQLAQAPRQTLLNWIKNKTEFSGRQLQSYYLAPVDRYFVSEESIQRIADRFVKWPSQQKAGHITLGETKDKNGFLTMTEAARIIGVSPRTMWLWASQDKAPTDKPMDIIKCTTSDHFYIREKDVYELKKLVPRSGLQRGRRSQIAARP